MVNLEKPLAVGGRFGGHFVLGHVDGVGRLQNIEPEGKAIRMTISCPEEIARYMAQKGSVAVNGVSLTIASEGPSEFQLVLVPYTIGKTNLERLRVSDEVNVECDIIAKYIEKLVGSRKGAGLSQNFLEEHGFIEPRNRGK